MVIVKHGDTSVTTWETNMNITGSTVRLIARNSKTKELYILACVITDAQDGVVSHQLTGTLPVGEYLVELEITQNSQVVTAPSKGYEKLCVIRDLA